MRTHTPISFRPPPDVYKKIEEGAATELRSLNMQVLVLVKEALAAREVTTPPKTAESPRD